MTFRCRLNNDLLNECAITSEMIVQNSVAEFLK